MLLDKIHYYLTVFAAKLLLTSQKHRPTLKHAPRSVTYRDRSRERFSHVDKFLNCNIRVAFSSYPITVYISVLEIRASHDPNLIWKADPVPMKSKLISRLRFEPSQLAVRIKFLRGPPLRALFPQGNVEIWLGKLLEVVRNTMHTYIRNAYHAISDQQNFKLIDFENVVISQCGLLGIQMIWTRDAELALTNSKADKKVRHRGSCWMFYSFDAIIKKPVPRRIKRIGYFLTLNISLHLARMLLLKL